jgi:TRAP-type C4-dicarboxylate transport system substrate-binding protein
MGFSTIRKGLMASIVGLAGIMAASSASAETLKYLTWKAKSAGEAHAATLQWFADEFEKRTGGKHKIEIFWGGSVAGIRAIPEALESGVGDLGDVVAPYFQDQFLLNNIVSFHMPQPKNERELGKQLMAWYDQYPQFDAEMAAYNLKNIGWRPLEDYGLMCTKPIKSAEDFKGLRVRTYGSALPRLFEALGATPVSMATPETYEALQRGILDCTPIGVTLARGYRFEEVAKYYIKFPLGANWGHFISVNLNTYNKLDEETRKILFQLGRDYMDHFVDVLYKMTDDIKADWGKLGIQVLPFPAAPVAKAVKSEGVQKIRQQFVDRATAKGIPAAEMVKFFDFKD